MDYNALNKQLLGKIGGKRNIADVTHCMSRLRITLKSADGVNAEEIGNLPGVMGAVLRANELQVVIGGDVVNVYRSFLDASGFKEGGAAVATQKQGNWFQRLLNTLAGIFNPIVPALAGAGLIKAILAALSTFGVISNGSDTYIVINTISDGVFTFLPFLLAVSAAKRFKMNTFVAVGIAAAMLHPNFTNLIANGVSSLSFLGLPLNLQSYNSSVLPIVLAIWFASYVEKLIDKITPKALKIIIVPAFTLLIATPIALMVVGPAATWVGNWISVGVSFLFEKGGVFAGLVYGGIYSAMVVTGLHHGMVPVLVDSIATYGYNRISPASGSANMAQAGAAFGVMLRSKNKNTKAVAGSACLSALAGVTEPAIYGVNLRLKKPFLCAAVGGACGGFFAALMGAKAYHMGGPSFLTLTLFVGEGTGFGNMWLVAVAFLIAFAVAAVMTLLLGFEEMPLEAEGGTAQQSAISAAPTSLRAEIAAPVSGVVKALRDVNDPTFAQGILGEGVAVEPSENLLVAPVDGVISTVTKTSHGIGITADSGAEILLHVGIDTNKLEGKYFATNLKKGDRVQKGQTLVTFEAEKIRAAGYDTTVMMTVVNAVEQTPAVLASGEIQAGQPLLKL